MSYEFEYTSYEFESTSYDFESLSYEFQFKFQFLLEIKK